MEDNNLYKTIFKRKSIRKFDLTPLDENTLNEISDRLQKLEPLHEKIKIEFKIISPDVVKRRMMKKAPHYIAVFSEVKEGYLSNVGFMLQQMDLFLSAHEIGACWQGIPTLKKEALESSNLKFVILMPFGKANETLHRTNISEFKRKPLHEITDIEGADNILEVAHLAPSATNAQPWFFTGDKNLIHACYIEPGRVKGLLTKKYPPMDVGIGLCHLKLAGEHFGRNPEIIFDKNVVKNLKKEYNYVGSLKLSE
jgi:nitroreductase